MNVTHKTKKQLMEELAESHQIIAEYRKSESENKRFGEALRQSEQRLKLFIEHAPAAIAMFDRNMRYIVVSHRWLSDYGLGDQDIIGRTHYEVFPEIPERWKIIHKRVLAGETVKCDNDPFPRLDGRIDWVRWEVLPWYEHNGDIGGIIMFTEVVTERKQIEIALQEAKDFAENLIETANAMVVGLDVKGDIQVFNQAAEKITGYTKEELKNRNWFELIVPRDRYPQVWSQFEGLSSGGLPKNLENPILTKTGEERYIIWQNNEVRKQGRVVGTVSFGIDITERKQAEEAILLANERLHLAQLAAGEGVWDWDLTTGKIEWTPEMFDLFGLDPQDTVASFQTWETVLHPEDCKDAVSRVFKALKDHSFLANEYRVIHPDGEVRWISALGKGLYNDQGRPLRMIGICLDITERKRSEEELFKYRSHLEELVKERTIELEERNTLLQEEISERKRTEEALGESEGKYRLVVENSYEAIIVAQDGMFRFVNSRAIELFHCREEELIAYSFASYIHPEDRDMVVENHQKRMMGEELPASYEFRIVDKDGNVKWVEINTIRISWKGSPATLNFLIEITERKKAEEEKRMIESQLAQTQRIEALDRFSGGIAHDLNNILYPIIINTEELLSEAPLDSSRHDILDQTLKAACRQRDLVKKILSFGRRSEQKLVPIKVAPLLEEAINFLRSTIPRTIEITQYIDAPSELIMGDPTQIQQVIVNLCQNAADALGSQKGTVKIRLTKTHLEPVHAHQKIQAGDYLELTVRDTGSGMPSEVMEHIFEPFYTTKEVSKGTGMGLSIVYGIVKSHGGTITAQSEPGKGTLFTVYLPIYAGVVQLEVHSPEGEPPDKCDEKILLVDDEEIILASLQRVLRTVGYHVVAIKDSLEALRLFEKAPYEFDLVVTDLTMPNMTGLELSRKVLGIRPEIPVVLCTGFNDVINEQEATSLGIRELLLKPTDSRELKKTVRKALEH